jgi:hypothetical protein
MLHESYSFPLITGVLCLIHSGLSVRKSVDLKVCLAFYPLLFSDRFLLCQFVSQQSGIIF